MWSYYGSKSKIIKNYPIPKYSKIIEPFAGSARYSLEYFDRDITIIDKYDVIVRVWKFLQQCSREDILSLPNMVEGDNTDQYTFDCIEQRWLMGFIINPGSSTPKKTVSKTFCGGKMSKSIVSEKLRIADNLYKIKHWNIIEGDYTDINNDKCTWFIDPPYQYGGQYYKPSVNNSHIDFNHLSSWSRERIGQVIVCENTQADWMEFVSLTDFRGSKRISQEAIWYKES